MNKEMKKNIDEILKEIELTQEEKDYIKANLKDLKQDEGYQLLKRRFYHELEGFDLDILALEDKDLSVKVKNKEEVIKELKKQKQEFIDMCGFIFDYKE